MKTLVTLTDAMLTCAVIVAAAVHRAIHRRPADITHTLIGRFTGTDALLTVVVATNKYSRANTPVITDQHYSTVTSHCCYQAFVGSCSTETLRPTLKSFDTFDYVGDTALHTDFVANSDVRYCRRQLVSTEFC